MESIISEPSLQKIDTEALVPQQTSVVNPLNFPVVESRGTIKASVQLKKIEKPQEPAPEKQPSPPQIAPLPKNPAAIKEPIPQPPKTQRKFYQYPPDSSLCQHQSDYFKNVKKLDYDFSNIFETVSLEAKLKKHRIRCMKYNYSLDQETYDFTCYKNLLQLSEDGKYIQLTNLKPKINNEYILEADPKEILKKQ